MLLTFDDRDGKQQNEFDLPPCDFVASDQIWKTDVLSPAPWKPFRRLWINSRRVALRSVCARVLLQPVKGSSTNHAK